MRALRLASLQQMCVGASWFGTRRRYAEETVLPNAVRESA
jgi:hypothetical protein